MRTRKDDKEAAGAGSPGGARATARVAPTILRKRAEKSAPGRSDHGDQSDKPDQPRAGSFNIINYMAGASALALVCFCLLCIIFLTIPAHASVGSESSAALTPLDTSTPSPTGTSTPSPTVTNTPSPTVTITPSPTVTNTPPPTVTNTVYPYPTAPTTTPAPAPSATRYVFPSPTTAATVGAKTSPTVAVSPGASPTIGATPASTLGASTNQGPGSSPTPANNVGDSSNSGSNPLADALPLILVGLGVIALLALLFIPVRIFLRKRLVPLPSPKLPPSGAAPWSRAPVSAQAQPVQPFPYAQAGNGSFYAPGSNGAPFPGGFNAMPTLANAPGATWNANAQPAGPYPPSMPPVGPAFPSYVNQAQPQPPRPFPAPPAIPTTNGYIGLTQNQQRFPTAPPLLSGAQVGFMGQQPGLAASFAPPGNPSGDANQLGDAFNSAARKRLRPDGLYTSGEHMAFGEQISGEASADMMVVSDPYLRAMLKQYSQKGQIVQQAPEESS